VLARRAGDSSKTCLSSRMMVAVPQEAERRSITLKKGDVAPHDRMPGLRCTPRFRVSGSAAKTALRVFRSYSYVRLPLACSGNCPFKVYFSYWLEVHSAVDICQLSCSPVSFVRGYADAVLRARTSMFCDMPRTLELLRTP